MLNLFQHLIMQVHLYASLYEISLLSAWDADLRRHDGLKCEFFLTPMFTTPTSHQVG